VIGVTAARAGLGYACEHRLNRKEASVTDRWWRPFSGMEELWFKRVPEGWVYRAPSPWLFGQARHYLLNDTQKTALAGVHRRGWRLLMLAIVVVVAAALPLTSVEAAGPVAVLAANVLIGLAIGLLWNAYLARAVGPTIAGLQTTTQRITRGEAIETQIAVFSGKYLLFFGLLSTALLALVTLPPLLASEGWDFWSICGALLFGACAAYWFALYIAKRRRSAA
jgi:hypothetical protein